MYNTSLSYFPNLQFNLSRMRNGNDRTAALNNFIGKYLESIKKTGILVPGLDQ